MPDTMMQSEMFRNRSAETAKIAAALAAAQKAFAPIPKDREVTVRTKTGSSYKFKYATLGAILSATMPALSEQGLAITQAMRERGTNAWSIETTLYHASGEWISNVTPMIVQGREGSSPGNQELGSAQSYARRYGISALLCLTADEDDDGNTADGGHIEHSEDRSRQPHKAGPPGSAAGGTDFRPAGPRRMPTSNWVSDAEKDGIVDANRTKGSLAKPPGAKIMDAVEIAQWCKASMELFKVIHTKADLVAWWKDNRDERELAEEKTPAEFERVIVAYDARMDTVAAKVA